MNDEILKEAFLAGRQLLKKHTNDDDFTSQVDLDSIIACHNAICKVIKKHEEYPEFNSVDVLADAYWSFIRDIDINDYYPHYVKPQEFSDLFLAIQEIALKNSNWTMNFGDNCDDIRDIGLNTLMPNDRWVERSDLSIKSLVDEALSLDDSVEFLSKLKKIFQDQVDTIEIRLQKSKSNLVN